MSLLVNRKRAYARLFAMVNGEPQGDAHTVLADLKRFARIGEAPIVVSPMTGAVDPIASAVRAGRQEAVNRILAMIHISDRAVFNLREEPDHD
ncbi:MAG: hypothetical protein JWP35_4663 [Caulobacter sp.]|nr:hypothetical protein [Caulobacter sp.]